MSFQIRLYRFSKKNGSTAVPSVDGEIHTGTLKNDSGIVNPNVLISNRVDMPSTDDGPFNYAYIPRFKRYYYISEMTWTQEGWILHMTVDVLATMRSVIGASTQYVIRSSNSHNSRIRDAMQYTIAQKTLNRVTHASPWGNIFNPSHAGRYIIGIICDKGGIGGVSYFSMTTLQLALFCATVFDSGSAFWNIQNPMDYIVSSRWSPIAPTGESTAQSIVIGGKSFTFTAQLLNEVDLYAAVSFSMTLPKHPQISSHGEWLELAPFSRYELEFFPFGTVALDASKLIDVSKIHCTAQFDFVSGAGHLQIFETADTTNNSIVGESYGQITTEIMLSRELKSISDFVSSFSNAAESLTSGNGFGFLQSGIGVASSLLPQIEKQGNNSGAFYGYPNLVSLYGTFLHTQPLNNTHIGRPLCSYQKISDLGGFIQCQNAHIQSFYTDSETAEAISFMNGGFIYE